MNDMQAKLEAIAEANFNGWPRKAAQDLLRFLNPAHGEQACADVPGAAGNVLECSSNPVEYSRPA
jgi:hypothetical protein